MPGDVPVGAVPAPEPAAAVTPKVPAAIAAQAARASKMVSLREGLSKFKATLPPDPAPGEKPVEKPVDQIAAPVVEAKPDKLNDDLDTKPADKLNDPAPDAKPIEPKQDELDDKTKRGLAAIEKQAKKFRDEQATERASLALERAELARLKAEITGKASSIDELKKLKPTDVLDKLGLDDDGLDLVARAAYARTTKGKADPRAAAAVAEAERTRASSSHESTIADLQKQIEDLKGEFTRRDQFAETRQYVTKWQDDAVKSIPVDKPTLIGKLHEKTPEKARQILLAIGQHIEKANDGETPTHAEVIAEYEKLRREELEEQGVDVDALLKPTVAPKAKASTKTLDVTSVTGVRPINGSPSKAEKLAAVSAGLKRLRAEQQ